MTTLVPFTIDELIELKTYNPEGYRLAKTRYLAWLVCQRRNDKVELHRVKQRIYLMKNRDWINKKRKRQWEKNKKLKDFVKNSPLTAIDLKHA